MSQYKDLSTVSTRQVDQYNVSEGIVFVMNVLAPV